MAQHRLDCSGHLCPVPILMTEEYFKNLKTGDFLEVIFTDKGAKEDLRMWCKAYGQEFVEYKENKLEAVAKIKKVL